MGTVNTMHLSELKLRLTPGTQLTLVEAPYLKAGESRPRTVMATATTHIKFEALEFPDHLSWMYWRPRTTVEVNPDGFRLVTDLGVLGYRWGRVAPANSDPQ